MLAYGTSSVAHAHVGDDTGAEGGFVVSTAFRSPKSAPLLVWFLGAVGYWLTILWVRLFHPGLLFDGFKLKPGGSDSAWQTIRLWEMEMVGPRTLWDMHVYPPLFDAIRFLLMQPETLAGSSPSALAVDQRLYMLNSILFGLVGMVVYLWVRDLTGNGWWAGAGAALWLMVPASLAYMSLMAPTGPAIAAMAVAFYLLYRFSRTRRYAYLVGFLAALLVVSLTRNVIQVHVLVILTIAAFGMWWITANRRPWMLVTNLLVVGLLAFWPLRAFALYATFDVSSHTGYNRAGALWIHPDTVPELVPTEVKEQYLEFESARKRLEDPEFLATLSASEVTELRKLVVDLDERWNETAASYPGVDFAEVDVYPDRLINNSLRLSSGWNTRELILANYRLGEATNRFILEQPLHAINAAFRSLTITVPTLFRSVSVQWSNSFSQKFPLSQPLDWIFSQWRFAVLIGLTVAIIATHYGIRGSWQRVIRYGWFAVFWILTAIPIFLSNRYWPEDIPEPTHSEADRLRALVDVPVYVLMTFAAFLLIQRIRLQIRKNRPAPSDQLNTLSG